jgi:probable addiction module antidote protein
MATKPFENLLHEDLIDPRFAADYLTECYDDGCNTFLVALRHVVEARGTMTEFARSAGIAREHLYTVLSEEGNPRMESLDAILKALGLKLRFTTEAEIKQAA